MRLEITPGTLTLTLSRRNLYALLHKLELDGSARRLVGGDSYLNGEMLALRFSVCCEEDDEHYAKRPEQPGEMHPLAERFIAVRSRLGNGDA